MLFSPFLWFYLESNNDCYFNIPYVSNFFFFLILNSLLKPLLLCCYCNVERILDPFLH